MSFDRQTNDKALSLNDMMISPSGALPQKNWAFIQRADDPDVKRANAQLKRDIAQGATGVALVFEGAHNAFGYGLPAREDTIARLFDGVDIEGLHIRFDNQPHGRILIDSFTAWLQEKRFDPAKTQLTFSTDPTAVLATTGHLKMSIAALRASLPQSMSGFFSLGLPGIVLEADGRVYHNAGATEAQELGAIMSVALAHMKMVEDGRHPVIYALPHIGFATALDQNIRAGLAKLRAIDILWQRLQKDYGIANPVSAQIHVETSMRMMTANNSQTNISRAAMAAVAAVVGGAKTVSVLPHSFANGLPNSYARHIACNSQLLLAWENAQSIWNNADTVADDANNLVEAAWIEFNRYEEQGGVLESLINGSLSQRLEEAIDLRLSAYLKKERIIVGMDTDPDFPLQADDIYEQAKSTYKPEGIHHCAPLVIERLETQLQRARTLAPVDRTAR